MKENKFTKMMENALTFADEHQRELFLGVQIVGTIMTGVLAWKAAPKAQEIVDKHKRAMEDIPANDTEKRRKETVETIKDVAPILLPPVITGAMTIGCALGGYKASTKQIAALSAAYTLSEKALTEYKDKALEIVGPKKAQTIKDEIHQDHVVNNPPSDTNTIINTGKGNTLCYDEISGRYFYHDPEKLRREANNVNDELRNGGGSVYLNEWYTMIGLEKIKIGNDIGFNVEDGFMDLEFSATLTEDNKPCLVLDYNVSYKFGNRYSR